MILDAIHEAVVSGARLFRACEVIGLGTRRYRRWIISTSDNRGGYRATTEALTQEEKTTIIQLFSNPELALLPVRTAHIRLMDKGILIASVSSCERIMKSYRRSQKILKKGLSRRRPTLSAKGPNQIWCWDITWMHSRPHTSNDNAFSESLFSTMKSRILYPEFFTSIEAATEFVGKFMEWYNYEHLHSGLDMTTPCSVHYGFFEEIMENRN